MGDEKVVKTICFLCPPACGMDVCVRDNKPVRVASMEESVVGPLCIKAEVIPEWYETEMKNRVLHPLQKVNGQWREITWDQALDTIAEAITRIKQNYGPQALAIYQGGVSNFYDYVYLNRRFALAYGTPSYYGMGSLCYYTKIAAAEITYGLYAPPTLIGAKCVVVWAGNPTGSVPFAADSIVLAKTQGTAKMIVIDPRRTLLAKAADIHLQLRPGTDPALALAFLNVIITEGLYDKTFVEKHTSGFDKLAEHVKQYTPEKVADITWVPADKIRAAARLYATIKPATIFQGNCLDGVDNGFQACRGIDSLIAITGNLDTRGGSTQMPFFIFEKLALEDAEKEGLPLPEVEPAGAAEGPIYYDVLREPIAAGLYTGMVDEKPYPIKGLLVQTGNPVVTLGDTNKFKRGVDKLDFMAVHEIFMTETAELADIILPSATFLEQQIIYQYVGRPMIVLLQKAIEPPEDCWPNWKVWLELGKRMGYEKYLPWKDVDDFENQAILKRIDITVDDMRKNPGGYFFKKRAWKKYETEGFATPSGKVELYSEKLARKGFDPLPSYHEPMQSPVSTPKLANKYPLILITGLRSLEFLHSALRGEPTLRGKLPEPMIEINTETARRLGIASGDRVIVETQFGMCEGKAAVTMDILPQVVSVPHGWGGLANQNYLTSWDIRTPEIGALGVRALQCRVRNADPSQAPKFTTV